MTFSIFGTIEDEAVQMTWKKGFVTGDKMAIRELFALASVLEGQRVGPEPHGPFTREDHLSNALSAMILMEDVLDEVTGTEGQLPGELRAFETFEAAELV